MPDHDAPHPVDKAYVEAEAVLDDEVARRARRARVLQAVAREPAQTTTAPPSRSRKPRGLRYVGWLTAASLAGLGGLIAYQLSPTASLPSVTVPETTTPEAASPPPTLDAQAPARVSPPLRRAPEPEERAPEAAQSAAAQIPPPAPVAPPPVAAPEAAGPPPPAAFPAAQRRAESVEARTAAPPAAPVAAQAPAARVQAASAAPTAGLGARLRAAAAAGRIAEVSELLAQGAPVDARDSDGETALMKSVRANQPQTAALLRRRGADPELENRAGVSARQMAEAADNPVLERALAPDR
jgi:hypothetical protein